MLKFDKVYPLEKGSTSQFYFGLMKFLTRSVSPFIRVRGLGVVADGLSKVTGGSDSTSVVDLLPTTHFSYPTFDSYWSYFVLKEKAYENELLTFFQSVSDTPFVFLDCGANFGYWSALLSSPELNGHPCLAVEASSNTFVGLRRNAYLNGQRFKYIQKALSDEDDQEIQFAEGGRHAGRHIVDGEIEKMTVNQSVMFEPGKTMTTIKTVSLDGLVSQQFSEEKSFLIKLDVEGAEEKAILGATELANKDSIFIYEDFGGDEESLISDFLLKQGFQIYSMVSGSSLKQVFSLADISAIKVNKRTGYNFLALRGNGPLTDKVKSLV
ncbi:MAG: FkbM family methyltransferase [Bdellovibrionales bacterium]|nr:FkbM family methyltransferase [Bdellovibrionales bacterium]NQZ17879.1 FkbM family methyltransferase [Bdellovibrionales bacterium]